MQKKQYDKQKKSENFNYKIAKKQKKNKFVQ